MESSDVITLVAAVLSGSALTAVITSWKDIKLWKANKKDKEDEREDLQEERLKVCEENIEALNETLGNLSKSLSDYMESNQKLYDAIVHSNKLIMCDRIMSTLKQSLIEGCITYEKRKLVHDMWDSYHKDWEGNGDLNLLMKEVDELPLKIKED